MNNNLYLIKDTMGRYRFCLILLGIISVVSTDDIGFDLFFKTNKEELNNAPIEFEKPLPTWIKGTLIRNGLGQFEMGERQFLHTFDGFGKLSSWWFPGNGSAFFSTRFLRSDFYKDSVDTNDVAPYLMFEGVTPDFNEAEKLEALVRGIDNMNVNIYRFFDQTTQSYEYVTLNDVWKVYKINPNNLQTETGVVAKVPNRKTPTGRFGFLSFLSSAHPLPEYGTTNHFTFVSSVSLVPWTKSKISLVRIKSVNDRELVAQWSVSRVPYMHSFSVTENHVIFFASPFYVNTGKMIKSAQPFESLDWFPDLKTNIYVVNTHTGEVVTIETDNVFSMHHVNAYEDSPGVIVVDISTYESPDFVKDLQLSILLDPEKRNGFQTGALLKRYIIDVKLKSVKPVLFKAPESVPFSIKLDMPVINEKYRHKEYCFVYGIVLKSDDVKLSRIAIVKKNVCGANELDDFWLQESQYPVEPWFVPNPESNAEDDGLLMVPVLDGPNNSSYIAFLDAKTMKLVNKAYLPTIVPYNLHGRFFEDL